MKAHALLRSNRSLPFPDRIRRSLPVRNSSLPVVALLRRTASIRYNLLRYPNFKVVEAVRFDGPMMDVAELESDVCELVVETCVVRTLPPSLTLEHGIQSIKDAVEELELNPPCSSRGVLRFQVAVPPGPKALNWFCSQPESSGVFPRFFMSRETKDPSCKLLYLNRTRGVFGIGAAIQFEHPSSCTSEGYNLIKRYLSSDSILTTAYGFMDTNFETKSTSIKHVAGSFYFLIPQIELNEHEDVSILSATLAWDDSLFFTFKQTLQSFRISIYQVSCHSGRSTERWHSNCLKSALRKLKVVKEKTFPLVAVNATLLEGRDYAAADPLELRGTISSHQFCFRLSPTLGVINNMLDEASSMSYSFQDFANINAVWASLIVEECSRLGLTYFCVAPGSRSSPLAIAASIHPLTTCISCFDERSLAFNAVGYGRGCHIPAVIITSSGTAVSNLLPAVVEASQGFVPLLLLTADRPPELHDVGANQAINQVNHFGSFVRFFFNLPTPTDDVPARMVLTTIDSAVHWATASPCGPAHINCPFREPLHGSPMKWMSGCLKGLDIWMSGAEPFTKYIQNQSSFACSNETDVIMHKEVHDIIQGAKKGLILLGAIHTDDEIWAVLLLARHLRWPVVADILSGLRLKRILPSLPENEQNVLFIDHLDHALLSNSVRDWMEFDVLIQVGSRITSKRISQMLEENYPCSYILIDNHPFRHDPSHSVTHRVQCSVMQFAGCLMKGQFPSRSNEWCGYLRTLDKMVAWDISFQINIEDSLTEPYVAHAISEVLSAKSAVFVGNSMPIRDVNMYGCNKRSPCSSITDMVLNMELPFIGIQVAGNRGASGIDGLLSTGVGFAIGSRKQVLSIIGDVSFLHDSNGLAILNKRMPREPMTILVINNHGGAIFSLLPIADRTDQQILDHYFYTSHDISIRKLCMAHGVKHLQVKTKMELQDALVTSRYENTDCVIEVQSCIKTNAAFHSTLRKSACLAADHAFSILSRFLIPQNISDGFFLCKIHKLEYSLYRIQLCAPPTSRTLDPDSNQFHKDGYILSLHLEDGSVGYGEVAPFEIRGEDMLLVEEQLKFLIHVIKGNRVDFSLPLLKGSFTCWIRNNLGIPVPSILPSVRCGLEMAILNALAARQGSSLLNILLPHTEKIESYERASRVKICALIDSEGTPSEVAHIAFFLVKEGFTTIKLKVARRADPTEDAAVVQEVRKKVGKQIELRVDANRKWTYEEATHFAFLVKDCDLQYIEEPVEIENDILRYCEETGLPVALDETIDSIQENPLKVLSKYIHPGIVAVVIKPTFIGGLEKAALIAAWAQHHGKIAVVSAAFESSLALSTFIVFSYYLELQNAEFGRIMNHQLRQSVAHGLGTYKWLKQDVTTQPLAICQDAHGGSIGASVSDANKLLQMFEINSSVVLRTFSGEEVCSYYLTVNSEYFSCSIKVHEVGSPENDTVAIFLHGFLGTGEDWFPIMKAISASARCISIDLPGHGGSKIQNHRVKEDKQEATLSIEIVAEMLYELIQHSTPGNVVVVGYSMGARIALHMALKLGTKIDGAVIISGSPGLKDTAARKIRCAKDDSRARALSDYGLPLFLDSWYSGELWKSLRSHPHFKQIVSSRSQHNDVHSLAKALSDLSVGRQLPLWEDLRNCNIPLVLIVGEMDHKFKAIAQKMRHEICQVGDELQNHFCELVEVPHCGHAVHLENPLPVVSALTQLIYNLRRDSILNQQR